MELRTLGTLALDGTDLRRHKPLLLLVYLALEGPQERSHLAQLFWPVAPQPPQRLRSTLELLRSGAPGTTERAGSKIMTSVRCDATDLQVALEDGNLERCVALYEGAFLEGLAAGRLGLELEEWVFATREKLAEYVRHALLRLADRSRSDPKQAAHYAKQAYLLVGAALPSPAQLRQILKALHAADDPLAAMVERDANDTPPSISESSDLDGNPGKASSRHNLTTPLTTLLGRGTHLLDLERRLASPDVRLLTLTGMGGVGKTRLAVELAWRQQHFYDAVYFISLVATYDPDEVLSVIVQTLELEMVTGRALRDVLVVGLQGKDVLLVLDNFEQVLGAAPAVADLLARCRRLKIVVTSRSSLRLRGENEIVVPPLPTPPATNTEDPLGNSDARAYASVTLFCTRVAEVTGRDVFTNRELAAIGDICRRVDGLPLAIELAASRAKLLSFTEILNRLGRGLDLLSQGALDLPERHHSLRSTLAWSYGLLTEDEKRLFRLLGVTSGGCDLNLATALWSGATLVTELNEDKEFQVLELFSSLLDKSLTVRSVDSKGDLMMTMLETVQRYAAEMLALDAGELRSNLEMMFVHLEGRFDGLRERVRNSDPGALAEVSDTLGNIRVAWLWAVTEGQQANILQVVMFDFFTVTGRYQDGSRLFSEVIGHLGDRGDAETKGRLYGSAAWFNYRLGDIEKAKHAAEACVVVIRQIENAEVLGVALETYGGILYGAGDYAHARVTYEEAFSIYLASSTLDKHLLILGSLGLIASAEGNYDLAIALFKQQLEADGRQGKERSGDETLSYLGETHRLMGDLQASMLAVQESYTRSHANLDSIPRIIAAYQLGMTLLALGDIARAETLLGEALQDAQSGHVAEFVIRAHLGLARTAAARGTTEHVSEHLLEALLTVKDTGLRPVALSCLLTIAELRLLVGLENQAATFLQVVREDAAAHAYDRGQATALISETDSSSEFLLETTSRLPFLIERVAEHLSLKHYQDLNPKGAS